MSRPASPLTACSVLARAMAATLSVIVLTASPAAAQTCTYPPKPSTGEGTVDRTRVAVGDCVKFEGDGFLKNSSVNISDNGAPQPAVKATGTGSFKTKVCFNSSASIGDHVLEGRGLTEGDDQCATRERIVTARVTVTGVQERSTGQAANGTSADVEGGGGGGGVDQDSDQVQTVGGSSLERAAVRTGSPSPAEYPVLLILVLVLCLVLLAGKKRRRSTQASEALAQ